MIELVEPTEEERGEGIVIICNEDPQLQKLDVPGKTVWIQCGCDYSTKTCPNNPSKKLIGMFQCCHIEIKKDKYR